jgi:Flp pilus assembly protein CpaB
MRAYTIQTPQVASNVAGFVLPGSRVDILLNLRGSGANDPTGGGSTTTILQAVEILAVDQTMDIPNDNKVDPKGLRSVTLLVTPQQAARLALGQGVGKLTLSLRRAGDLSDSKTTPERLKDLWQKEQGPNEFVSSWLSTVGAVAKAWSVAKVQPSESVPVVEDRQPEAYSIRTLRGIQRGLVFVNVGK